MTDVAMVWPPTVHRVRLDRSKRSRSGRASIMAYMVGTPSNIVAWCSPMSSSASTGSNRSISTTVPPAMNRLLITTLPYTWGAGRAVTTMSSEVRTCMVAVSAQLRYTARCDCMAPLGWPVVPDVYPIVDSEVGDGAAIPSGPIPPSSSSSNGTVPSGPSPKTITLSSAGASPRRAVTAAALSADVTMARAPQSFRTNTTSSGVSMTLIGFTTAPALAMPW